MRIYYRAWSDSRGLLYEGWKDLPDGTPFGAVVAFVESAVGPHLIGDDWHYGWGEAGRDGFSHRARKVPREWLDHHPVVSL